MTVRPPLPGISRLRHWGRRIVRAYQLCCAREDARVRHVVIPAGVWVCQHCPHFSFDATRLRDHLAYAH